MKIIKSDVHKISGGQLLDLQYRGEPVNGTFAGRIGLDEKGHEFGEFNLDFNINNEMTFTGNFELNRQGNSFYLEGKLDF